MKIIRDVNEMKIEINSIKRYGKTIGFVPTMGYLHDGHKSLIDTARKENDIVVVSIFVNPVQFGPNEDFEKYPRDEERDFKICRESGCDIVFLPVKDDMYKSSHSTFVDVFNISEGLCGLSRPGHFRGVATVVAKLFNIVKADRAYFGQKDAQQLAIIKKMTLDLNMDTEVIGCPIIREADGLAMSSRNIYLNCYERQQALTLSKSLMHAQSRIKNGEKHVSIIKLEMEEIIKTAQDSKIDYIEVVDPQNLKPVHIIEGEVLIALAVRIGNTRLIDNLTISI
jgi:pantoate--beta-alanine ligase